MDVAINSVYLKKYFIIISWLFGKVLEIDCCYINQIHLD
jgi:hypothetical protein